MRFKDTKQYAAARKWRKAHPEHINALQRAGYHRRHPGAPTREELKAERETLALRTEKPCKRCGILKPISEFGPCKKTADGRRYQCRRCAQDTANIRYAKDPAKYLAKKKAWDAAHPEKKQLSHTRRPKDRKIPGSHTRKQWEELCAKFKHRCVRCGKSGSLTRDHVLPLSYLGSTDDISNIQPLCFSCNSSKGNRHAADYRRTPFVNQGQLVLF